MQYNQCGYSKEHVTGSYMIAASGDVLPVRLVYVWYQALEAEGEYDPCYSGKHHFMFFLTSDM